MIKAPARLPAARPAPGATRADRRAQALAAVCPLAATVLAAMALLAPPPVRAAAGAHAETPAVSAAAAPAAARAEPAAATPAERDPAVAAAPPQDPMTHLKRRLQETLGARLADDARGTHELEVPLRRPAAPATAARAGGRPASRVSDARGADRAADRPAAGDTGWGYEGANGPAHWGELHPDYALCGRGARQSPIDLRDGVAVDLHPVRFDYRPSRFSVIDNGHTVQVQVGAGNTIEVGGRRYELQHFHFRRPSEERIEGRQFEMSAHLVHRDADGRLAIVAVVLERGPALPAVQQVWNDLPLEKHVAAVGHGELDPTGLLPAERRYYTYMGSLTTPPCTEGVLWMVMQQPVTASAQQIDIFSRLYPMNARPVQQASGRLVKQSN